jgi:hypothetical protein
MCVSIRQAERVYHTICKIFYFLFDFFTARDKIIISAMKISQLLQKALFGLKFRIDSARSRGRFFVPFYNSKIPPIFTPKIRGKREFSAEFVLKNNVP